MSDSLKHEALYDQDRLERYVWTQQRATGLARREVLKRVFGLAAGAAGAGFLGTTPRVGFAQSAPAIVKPTPADKFITLGTNRETRFEALKGQGYLTPASLFFVRNHTVTPTIAVDTWSLRVEGSGVSNPRSFTLNDLLSYPAVSKTHFIECAGNGRSFFGSQQGTPASGSAWRLGAIGVGQWTGVRLSTLLEAAGLKQTAVDVQPEGLDPEFVSGGVSQGRVRRSIPIQKVLDDVLVVYALNGEFLPPDHGFPARLLVPGWIGIANIKWLGRIEVAETPLFSFFNTAQYRFVGNDVDYPQPQPPLTKQVVKSAFELPFPGVLPRGLNLVTGRSWSANGTIARVDVSFDDGATWRRATLKQGGNDSQAWAEWQVPWVARAGQFAFKARATDSAGNTQPDTVPFNAQGYLFSAVVRHAVTVA